MPSCVAHTETALGKAREGRGPCETARHAGDDYRARARVRSTMPPRARDDCARLPAATPDTHTTTEVACSAAHAARVDRRCRGRQCERSTCDKARRRAGRWRHRVPRHPAKTPALNRNPRRHPRRQRRNTTWNSKSMPLSTAQHTRNTATRRADAPWLVWCTGKVPRVRLRRPLDRPRPVSVDSHRPQGAVRIYGTTVALR